MRILAHRGYWNKKVPSNSPLALKTALEKGFGLESDVRDYMGYMVISHNIADSSCQNAEQIFKWLADRLRSCHFNFSRIMLCTDYSDEARIIFKDKL